MQQWWRKKHPQMRRRSFGWLLIGIGVGLALAAIPGPVWVAVFFVGGIAALCGWLLSGKRW